MFEEKNNSQGFLLGLLAGGVIGALAALLYAPKSGKEFRQDIVSRKNDLLDDAELMLLNAQEKASRIISDAKNKAESILEDGKKKVESFTSKTDRIISDGKEKIEEGTAKVKDAVKSSVSAYNDERSKLGKEDEKMKKEKIF